ncbi:MAG: FecR family protein [Cytophagaceae bacterium]
MAEELHNRNEEFIHDLIAKQLQGELSEREQKILLAWISEKEENKFLYEKTVKAWEFSGRKQENFQVDTEAAWAKVRQRTAQDPKVIRIWERPAFQIAASLVFLITLGYLTNSFFRSAPEYTTVASGSERMKIYLPDSSIVWLNKHSSVKYSDAYNKYLREVQLDGEAFFDVRRDESRKFVVKGHHSLTEVLGTSFIVKSYHDRPEESVEVVTGKVSFTSRTDSRKSVLLTPGLQGKLDGNGMVTMQQIQDQNFKAWKEKKLEFDNTNLSQVIQSLNSYFDNQVIVSDSALLQCSFTGSFENPELEQIISIISVSLNVDYKKEQNRYILSGQGCTDKNH